MTAHLPHELVYDILATHLHELLFSTPPDPPRVSSASHGSSATYLGTVGALARASSTYHALARELLWQKVSVGMPRTWTSIMKVVEAYEEHEQASPDQVRSSQTHVAVQLADDFEAACKYHGGTSSPPRLKTYKAPS